MSFALAKAAVLADGELANANSLPGISRSSPSERTLREYIKDLATDVTFLALSKIKQEKAQLYLMCGKGAKKATNAHFVKILCWWSPKDSLVKTFTVNTDDCESKSSDAAMALDHAL